MNITSLTSVNAQLKIHRTYLLGFSGMLLMSNLLLCIYLTRQDSRTIIIPSHLNKEFAITDKEASEEYLELMARDWSSMILNLTPDNYEYVEKTILKHTHPDFYGIIRQELMELHRNITERNVAISFFMSELRVNKPELRVDITGYVETRIGLKTVSKELKKYRITFDYTGARLCLKEFYEVHGDEKTE